MRKTVALGDGFFVSEIEEPTGMLLLDDSKNRD